eukprot:CAMPEP_0198311574 /NCGR_PEP_ID=MMETSP1450-20131203/3257_1 /TAXON_ID=753684 ORGANISM="Madagascaria erythrocladiodes, Strain CCMP3234" /NCGR_SAMPLE_ID=MMETSP1450 /ASSEMBLY_ACC=CAM_ASM_001115 /LENGTH=269 /DNA_ID=CAMNT_0044014471 /DNA_START=100 /DNA_END=906 /DNA_ORIENTATION=+
MDSIRRTNLACYGNVNGASAMHRANWQADEALARARARTYESIHARTGVSDVTTNINRLKCDCVLRKFTDCGNVEDTALAGNYCQTHKCHEDRLLKDILEGGEVVSYTMELARKITFKIKKGGKSYHVGREYGTVWDLGTCYSCQTAIRPNPVGLAVEILSLTACDWRPMPKRYCVSVRTIQKDHLGSSLICNVCIRRMQRANTAGTSADSIAPIQDLEAQLRFSRGMYFYGPLTVSEVNFEERTCHTDGGVLIRKEYDALKKDAEQAW